MSHFTTIKTEIRNVAALKEAARALGLTLEEKGEVRGYAGRTTNADYVIRLASDYDIGFCLTKDKTYEIVADWFSPSVAQAIGKNGGRLLQEYSYAVLKMEARRRGQMITRKTLEDGTVQVTIRGGVL